MIKYKEKYKKIGSLELSREILRRGKNLRIPIVGESMYPIFKRGDIIIIKPVKIEDLSVGDVVLYQSGKRMVAHRLIKKCINNGKMTFVMKGDSFPDFDPPVYPEDVIGKVIAIEREERTLRLDRGLNKLMNIFCAKISPFSHWTYPAFGKIQRGIYNLFGWVLRKLQNIYIYNKFVKKYVLGEIQYIVEKKTDESKCLEIYVLAKREDTIIGNTTVKKIPETDYPFSGWWFLGVFVNPLYRRMGIGEELMKVAIETVAKEGASTIKSTVFENNIPGIKLSKKLGFQKIYIPDLEKQFQEEYKRGSPKQSVLEKNINNYE